MSYIGKKLPEFKVQAYHEKDFKTVTCDDVLGHWSVFFFYPADFTFVCPTELEDLANCYDKFKEIGCEIYSVSTDTHFCHKAWADTTDTIAKVKYPMLADPTGCLTRFFDVMIEEEGMALRATFVMNPDGEVKAYEVHDNGIGRDADELLRKVQAAQFISTYGDQVCPAKWKPGADTLKPSLDLVGKL